MIEQPMSDVLGEFARTVVTDFSVEETLEQLVHRAVEILPVTGARITLLVAGGIPRCVAASDETARRCGQLQIAVGEGPGLFACETERAVDWVVGEESAGFVGRALDTGVVAGRSFPFGQGDEVVGALDLYQDQHRILDDAAVQAAQALADVAAGYLMIAQARVDSEETSERARRSSAHDDASELALRTSEQRKTAILASVLDAVITIDASGCVLEFNPAAERIFGSLEHDVTGRDLADLLVPPDALAGRWIGIDRFLASGENGFSASGEDGPLLGRRIELIGTRVDGSTFPAEVTITAVNGPGAPLFSAFVRDLTGRKAAEAERRDLERRMQQSERLGSLGQLAGGVAHDFNNLLTVILNYASFIAEAEANDDQTRIQAGEIVASAERAADLTKQLLLFARREPVQRMPLDIGAIVGDLRDLLVQAVGEAVELVIVSTGGLPLVTGDRGQIEQVLMNLAVNARDAMPGGGTLTIETSLVRLGLDEFVELLVTDTGEGMREEVAAHAFDPFFTTKAAGRGSGLGLATVYGVVSDAGGTVDLTSVEGSGTSFTVRLPVPSEPEMAVATPPVPDSMTGSGETILVVEDQVPVRKVIVAMLRRNGYCVVDAADATDAFALALDEKFDLLLTDVVMPGLSGRDLVAQLRRQRPDQQVLYMSGYSGGAFGAERALDHGEELIHKPFKERELLAAVHGALGGIEPSGPALVGEPAVPGGVVG